jgi:hypothetical protein
MVAQRRVRTRYRVRAHNARSLATPDRDKQTYTPTRHNSTNIAPIDDALAAIEALKPGERLVYQRFADQYRVRARNGHAPQRAPRHNNSTFSTHCFSTQRCL